jgi:hypothetical protein
LDLTDNLGTIVPAIVHTAIGEKGVILIQMGQCLIGSKKQDKMGNMYLEASMPKKVEEISDEFEKVVGQKPWSM